MKEIFEIFRTFYPELMDYLSFKTEGHKQKVFCKLSVPFDLLTRIAPTRLSTEIPKPFVSVLSEEKVEKNTTDFEWVSKPNHFPLIAHFKKGNTPLNKLISAFSRVIEILEKKDDIVRSNCFAKLIESILKMSETDLTNALRIFYL